MEKFFKLMLDDYLLLLTGSEQCINVNLTTTFILLDFIFIHTDTRI